MTLTLAQVLADLRTDLGDLDPSNYRWSDTTLQRQVDRALDRYSNVSPFFQAVQISTVSGSLLYASPTGSWYIDRCEYPLGQTPRQIHAVRERLSPLLQDPSTAPSVVGTSGGNLTAATFKYAYTFTVPGGGETKPSPLATLAATAGQAGSLTSIPTGPYGVTGRNLYRSRAGGSTLYLLASLPDNSTASYVDTLADASLPATTAPTSNTTAGIPQFEIDLNPYATPQDASGTIEVTYASRHLLNSNGTTVPEEHWDALHLGAQAYAAQQYLSAVNDNFEWVDGQFRDRVDDTKSIDAWRSYYTDFHTQFEARLKEIRNQIDTSITSVIRWGDKPYRWDRL
jgi:hypothetical protein